MSILARMPILKTMFDPDDIDSYQNVRARLFEDFGAPSREPVESSPVPEEPPAPQPRPAGRSRFSRFDHLEL